MSAKYETGTASNSADLTKKLFTFMSTVSGWQLWSNIDGYVSDPTKPYDMVYRSTGSTGRNEIFVRARRAPVEPYLRGADYYDWDDTGDTGYMVFQSYVSFPQGGDAYEGYSEIGQNGPRYMFQSGSDQARVWRHSPISAQNHGSPAVVNSFSTTAPSNDTIDGHAQIRNKFQIMNSGFSHNNSFVTTWQAYDTDGKANIYAANTISSRVERYNLSRGGGQYSGSQTSNGYDYPTVVSFTPYYLTYAIDRSTGVPYLFCWESNSNGPHYKLNLITESWSLIADPVWPARIETFMFTSGLNSTTQGAGGSVWDGGDNIYFLRGGSSGVSSSLNTPDWGKYHIPTDTWKLTVDPHDPTFPELPYEIVSHRRIAFYSKTISGFDYNRVYIFDTGEKEVWYLNVDDSSGNPVAPANWISTGQVDNNSSGELQSGAQFQFLRNGRVNLFPARIGSNVPGMWEFTGDKPRRSYLQATSVKESGLQHWESVDASYFPQGFGSGSDGCMMSYLDGYMCRVRTTIGEDTPYIFIADEDRVIVATKSRTALASYSVNQSVNPSEWSFAYVGAFESAYEDTPYGELAHDVKAGTSRKAILKNIEGEFTPNDKYFIIDTTGAGEVFKPRREGTNRKVAFSESIKITNVEGNVITFSPRNNYKKGSKIAIDPQPVCAFLADVQKFQTTNVVNREYDDFNGSDDPSEQIYTVAKPEDSINSSAVTADDLGQPIPIWPFTASNAEGEGNYIGREIRGDLKGVFAVGKFTSPLGDFATISVGDKSYFIIDVPQYQSYVAIGPIREGDL